MTHSIMTLSIMTLSIMTLSITILSVRANLRHSAYMTVGITDSITTLYHYAECHVLFVVILGATFYLLLC
jgi:hypothetical protein